MGRLQMQRRQDVDELSGYGRLEQNIEAGKKYDYRLNNETGELLPEEVADDPALDELFAD